MIDYKQKYEKYKLKYLRLKQSGGMPTGAGFILLENYNTGNGYRPCVIMFRRISDNKIQLPGGLIDHNKGEHDPLHAATRELREESLGMFGLIPEGPNRVPTFTVPYKCNDPNPNAYTFIVKLEGPSGGIRSDIFYENRQKINMRQNIPHHLQETDLMVRVPLDELTITNLGNTNYQFTCYTKIGGIKRSEHYTMRGNSLNVLKNAIECLHHRNSVMEIYNNPLIPVHRLSLHDANQTSKDFHDTKFYK